MILETLTRKYNQIQKLQHYNYKRYFHRTVDFNDKMVGILGHRGVGKTTFILQYLKSLDLAQNKKLYFSADSILLSNVSIYDIADEFSGNGGKVLVIDEIHKYKNFEHELKEIYDFLDLKVIFSGSSALQLEHKKADLSRRAVLYRVHGLSFREFLELKLEKQFHYFSLEDILENHIDIANELIAKFKPFEYFNEYLKNGYFPYYFENPNTNLSFYYCHTNEIGTIREQFFVNMLRINHQLLYPLKGDFMVDEKYTFEIGGKNKSFKQLQGIKDGYVIADEIEVGFGNKIPLWLFGFLY
jgi:predicted AAA+ superfamily ATPase